VPSLIRFLESNDRRSQELAAELLEELGPVAAPAVPALVKCLDERRGRVRICVIEALREIGPGARDAVGPLSALQRDGRDVDLAVALYCIDPTPERLKAARNLIEPGLPASGDDFDNTRHQLMQLRPRPIAWLVEILRDSQDRLTRRIVAAALLEEPERVQPYIVELISLLSRAPALRQTFDEDPYEAARLAADVLAGIGPPVDSAADSLIDQLDSPSWEIRVSSIRALGRVATRESAPRIIEALRSVHRDSGTPNPLAEFALRQIGVRLGSELSNLPPGARNLIDSTAPFAQHAGKHAARWSPPPDANVDPPPQTPLPATLAELQEFVAKNRHSQPWDHDAVDILEFGEGALDVQQAAPLLLLLHEQNRHEFHRGPVHAAIVHALWRLTRSPLTPAIMVDARVAPAQTVREMGGSVGEALGPYLLDEQTEQRIPAALLLPLLGPRAREELPVLWGQLKQSDGGSVGAVAGLTIWRIDRDPAVIPELIRQLKPAHQHFVADSQGMSNREFVAWALGSIGPPAKAAVPLLAEVAYRDSREFGVAAAWAVRQIDPQAADKWGIQ